MSYHSREVGEKGGYRKKGTRVFTKEENLRLRGINVEKLMDKFFGKNKGYKYESEWEKMRKGRKG